MKLLTLGTLCLLGLFAAAMLAGCLSQSTQSSKGRVVFAMADAAMDMNTVSSIKVTVDQAELHSASQGWVSVSSQEQTYDLMQLRAQGGKALVSDSQVEQGTYDQLLLHVSQVVVTDSAGGVHPVKMPSNEIKMNGIVVVDDQGNATATFDVLADQSMHITSKGEYVFTPVIALDTRQDANVTVKENNGVAIEGGTFKTIAREGMMLDGTVEIGQQVPVDADIVIGGDGFLRINSGLQGGIGLPLQPTATPTASGQPTQAPTSQPTQTPYRPY